MRNYIGFTQNVGNHSHVSGLQIMQGNAELYGNKQG